VTEKLLKFLSPLNVSVKSRFLLAVSGGIDSMAMTDIFIKAGMEVSVAHCNFNLREKESDEDEHFVADYCRHHHINFHSKSFNTKSHAKKYGLSVEMAARELRYGWFDQLMNDGAYHYLCTAHHRNDSVETVLFNLIRGTGIDGLTGILPLRGKILRPLLWLDRQDILRYAKKNNLKWREDRSNTDDSFRRNFIRKNIVPLMEEINPNFIKGFKTTSERLIGTSSLAEKHITETIQKAVNIGAEHTTIKKSIFNHCSPEEAKVILYNLLSPFGFAYPVMADIYKSVKGQPGKMFFSDSHVLYSQRESWAVCRADEQTGPTQTFIDQSDVIVSFGGNTFEVSVMGRSDWKMTKSRTIAQLDFHKITFPVTVRKWLPGDYFYPLGMTGKKKVSDFLTDRKVSISLKKKKIVFLSDNKIIWVAGEQIDDYYKVAPPTKKILVIEEKND